MTRRFHLHRSIPYLAGTLTTAAALVLALPAETFAQRQRGGTSSGTAQPRDGSGSGGSSGGSSGRSSAGDSGRSGSSGSSGRDSGDRSGGGRTASRGDRSGGGSSGSGSGTSTRSGGGTTTRATGSDSGSDGTTNTVPDYSRPRDGRNATGRAAVREPGTSGGGTTVIVTNGGYYGGGSYPWGYGGLGFGGYYGGYYDPFWDDAYYGGYSGYGGYDDYDYDGALRLKIKQRDAAVYVDGYYAGRVDDFDGIFQRLRVESGPHRIEVRLDGFEPLMFEVRLQPDRTITYTGELNAMP